jgi:hypothetical protein
MATNAGLMLLMAACSSVEKQPVIRTVYLQPTLPPAAEAADPQLSLPPRDADLSQSQVIDFWNTDRSGLKACIVQKHAAVAALKGVGQ